MSMAGATPPDGVTPSSVRGRTDGAAPDPSGEPTLPAAVRRAIAAELLDADLDSAAVLGEGWNVVAWRLAGAGGDWVVRVPKLDWAAGEIARQMRLGAHLEQCGLPVPADCRAFFDRRGRAIAGAYRFVPGRPAPTRDKTRLRKLAQEIAEFLSRLHRLPVDYALRQCEALDLEPLSGRYAKLIADFGPLTGPRTQAWLQAATAELQRLLTPPPPHVLVHGDLSPEHVICDEADGVTGVLDFSGPQVTDAALDFARIVQRWGAPFAGSVLVRYGGAMDRDFPFRMMLYAKLEPLRAIEAGVSRDLPEWTAWGRRRLAAAAAAY